MNNRKLQLCGDSVLLTCDPQSHKLRNILHEGQDLSSPQNMIDQEASTQQQRSLGRSIDVTCPDRSCILDVSRLHCDTPERQSGA